MKYGCYIVDDEPLPATLIIDYVNRHDELFLIEYESNPEVAAAKLLSGEIKADICFLDVQMAGIDGIELAKLIKHLTGIIFTTGYREYAPEAYELDAIDYLLKPVRYVRFIEAIEKAKRYFSDKPSNIDIASDFFFVKDVLSVKKTKIFSDDLVAIEGNGNFGIIHRASSPKPIMSNLSMRAIAAKAASQNLCKVHKSFVVNLAHVVTLYGNEITMTGDLKVSLSRRYRSQFLDKMEGR